MATAARRTRPATRAVHPHRARTALDARDRVRRAARQRPLPLPPEPRRAGRPPAAREGRSTSTRRSPGSAALAFILVVGNRRSVRETIREIDGFDADDVAWLRRKRVPQGRLNAGQKLNAIVTVAFAVLFSVTGFFLWYGERDTRFRFANTLLIHDWLMYASFFLFLGHLYLSVIHPATRHALNGITRGWVNEDWALRHHEKWARAVATAQPRRRPGLSARPTLGAVGRGCREHPACGVHPLARAPSAACRSPATRSSGRGRSRSSTRSGRRSGTTSRCRARTSAVLGRREMPGAEWFPGAELSYAEHLFRGKPDDAVAIVHASELRPPARAQLGRAARADRADRGGPALGRRRARRPRRRLHAEHPRGGGRVPGLRVDRRDLVELLARLRRAQRRRPVRPDRAEGAARGRRLPLRRARISTGATSSPQLQREIPTLERTFVLPYLGSEGNWDELLQPGSARAGTAAVRPPALGALLVGHDRACRRRSSTGRAASSSST